MAKTKNQPKNQKLPFRKSFAKRWIPFARVVVALKSLENELGEVLTVF